MTTSQIISQVKWCIDHETRDDARLADLGEDTYMDNIIRAKIADALLWVTRMAAANAALGTVAQVSASTSIATLTVRAYPYADNIGLISVPDTIVAAAISRVRIGGWHKAAVPIPDTADDAAMMFDDTAHATADRPMAVLMAGNPIRVLAQPYDAEHTEVEVTLVGAPATIDTSSDTADIDVPPMLRSAFLYYIAYLLLTAYADPRAQAMLAVAVQSVGSSNTKSNE